LLDLLPDFIKIGTHKSSYQTQFSYTRYFWVFYKFCLWKIKWMDRKSETYWWLCYLWRNYSQPNSL